MSQRNQGLSPWLHDQPHHDRDEVEDVINRILTNLRQHIQNDINKKAQNQLKASLTCIFYLSNVK